MRRVLSVLALVMLPSIGLAQEPGAVAPGSPSLSRKWSGYWISDTNGHRGPLHAKFTQISDDEYRVRYRGRFALIVPFRYSTTMNVVGAGDGAVILVAEKPLGPFGTFRTTATATGTHFDATFTSRRDTGKFVLNRR
jgi:hypothetical protein